MALIKCEECGIEYSDKAEACPRCACHTIINTIKEKRKNIPKCSVEITGNETFDLADGPQNKIINKLTWAIISILALAFWGWGLSLSSTETAQFLGEFNSEMTRGFIFIILPFLIVFLFPVLIKLTPEYRQRVKNIEIIKDYFKKRFILFNSMPNTFSESKIVSAKSNSYESTMFKIYQEAYNFDADAIVINDSNVSTHVKGSIKSNVISGGVSGTTTSTNIFHITATLVRY